MSEPTRTTGNVPDSLHGQLVSGAHLREGWDALALLMSGALVFGGAAWWLSSLTGWVWLLPVGLVGGMGASIAYVWFRYGVVGPDDTGPSRAPFAGAGQRVPNTNALTEADE